MAKRDYDFLVIGGGSGGVRASRVAADLGARTALCESRALGGTCVNAGCVPKKLLVYASQVATQIADAEGFGWEIAPPRFDWKTLVAQKDREISRLNQVYGRLLDRVDVNILRGRATLLDPHRVEIAGQTYTADKILIATGGRPFVPDFPGREHVITSDEAFHLETLPARVVIIGGGYIATEFAGIFNGMGSRVTQLYRGDLFLRGFDRELREHLMEEVRGAGVDLRLMANVRAVTRDEDGLLVTLESGEALRTDCVMAATMRRRPTWLRWRSRR